jgi:hypothetical protein
VQRHVTFEYIVSRSYFFTNDFNIHAVYSLYIASVSIMACACCGIAFIKM